MTLDEFNRLPKEKAQAELLRCCGSKRWSERMAEMRPYPTSDILQAAAHRLWSDLGKGDWIEAFGHHPKIGDREELRKKYSEQSGVAKASEATLQALAQGNADYEKRFGFIFIVCATGKSADEMLAILNARLPNAPEQELRIAAEEQGKITRIRLKKLIEEREP
jgi:2-oxo-4-hydroxy-4-carboxy-5-ureidoimidazoline decarboxylase